MISFNRLGNLGRLGNQMFQYAAIKGIAAHHIHKFCIPPKKQFGIEDKKVLEDINNTIYDIFELGEFEQKLLPNSMVMESTHAFDRNLYANCPDNVDLLVTIRLTNILRKSKMKFVRILHSRKISEKCVSSF